MIFSFIFCSDFLILPGFIDFSADGVVSKVRKKKKTFEGCIIVQPMQISSFFLLYIKYSKEIYSFTKWSEIFSCVIMVIEIFAWITVTIDGWVPSIYNHTYHGSSTIEREKKYICRKWDLRVGKLSWTTLIEHNI